MATVAEMSTSSGEAGHHPAGGARERRGAATAADWDHRWTERLREGVREPNGSLVAELERVEPGRALDLASGAGRNAVWLAGQGWEVTAVDFSRVALRAAAELAERHGVEVDLVEADVVTWEPPRDAFDLVCVMYVQLPPAERAVVLERAAAALAPGGVLLVVAHDPDNLTRGYGGPSNPAVLYAADEVADLVAGLVIERAGQVARTVETDGGERQAIDLLVRARRPRA